MSMGARITEKRKDKGYTQEFIAEKMGVSRQAVSKWEKDLCAPDTKNLIALAGLLDTTVEYLATGRQSDAAEDSRTMGKVFYRASVIPLALILLCWMIGLLSGEYTDMVTIPVHSGMRVGIPFLLYGKSPAAIALLLVSAVSALLLVLLLFLGYYSNKDKK